MRHDPADATSETLLGRVGLGPHDAAAWGRFVAVYGPKIRSWCRRWGLQEADCEDITQDVLLRIAGRLATFRYDPSRSFRGWLRTLTHNALADFAADRKRQACGNGGPDALAVLETAPARDDLVQRLEAQFDAEVLAEACHRARGRVEPQTWEAFRLLAHEGLSGDDVAARLGLNSATVFKAKSRVMGFIREEIRRLEGDD
jgi:RNA polymerase sigma-70 factor (ECF subfamily)